MFHKYAHNEKKMQIPNGRRALPSFFFPGILGDGGDFGLILDKLDSAGIKNLYVFYDKRFEGLEPPTTDISLDQLVEAAVDEIQSILPDPPGSFPVFIFGYSAGCTWGTKAAQLLEKRGEKPYIFLIDGVAPQCIVEDFKSYPNINIINHEIKIVNYAATYAELPELISFINENEIKEIKHFKKIPAKEAIDVLITRTKNINFKNQDFALTPAPYEYVKFASYMAIIKTNLNHLIDYIPDENAIRLKNMTALITNENAKKYGPYAGWEAFADNIKLISSEYLQTKNHFELVQDTNVTEQLAASMVNFIKHSITKKEFKIIHNNYIINNYETSNDDDSNDSNNKVVINNSDSLLRKSKRIHIATSSMSGLSSPDLNNTPPSTDTNSSPVETDHEEEEIIVTDPAINSVKNKNILASASRLFSLQKEKEKEEEVNNCEIFKQPSNQTLYTTNITQQLK